MLIGNLILIGTTFMLRADELLSIEGLCEKPGCQCPAHVHFDNDGKSMRLRIAGGKTNIELKTVTRSVRCSCPSPCSIMNYKTRIFLCAVCAVKAAALWSGWKPGQQKITCFISNGVKRKPMQYDGLMKGFQKLLIKTGERTIDPSTGAHLFGCQSMRRGGAQLYTFVGWPLGLVQLWGRWESLCVYRYVLEAPLPCSGRSRPRASPG